MGRSKASWSVTYIDVYSFGDELVTPIVLGQSWLIQEAAFNAVHFGNVAVLGLFLNDRVQVESGHLSVQLNKKNSNINISID